MKSGQPAIEDILNAYRCGLFPMAERADSKTYYWYDPDSRGQLSIENLRIPRRLRALVKRYPFEVTTDKAFEAVIDACAEETSDRPLTWINKDIRDMFVTLHEAGHAHSVECWKDGVLVGGIYGLAFGSAFAGESMFSRVPNASKIALIHLCARLWKGGFTVFDTQFVNPHLTQFGVYEIPRDEYRRRLSAAAIQTADFTLFSLPGLTERQLIQDYMHYRFPPGVKGLLTLC